jgi:hypothetical protein
MIPFRTAPLASLVFVLSPVAVAQFYGDPPDDSHPWAVHDMNRPQPPVVRPGNAPGAAPSDAVVLFDGTKAAMENWTHEKADRKTDWKFQDGVLVSQAGAGYITTKRKFGDCQLHVEWAAPDEVKGDGQGRGNSGIFLLDGFTEVQVLDNFNNPTYADGTAGSVYGVNPPLAVPLRGPGEWQSYDIIFRKPIMRDGKLIEDGRVTVLVNGVVVQESTALEGGGGHRFRSKHKARVPDAGVIKLQDHGNPVRFRNIWVRELPPRLSEDVAAKRGEIAAAIRKDAEGKTGLSKLYRLMESLTYATDASVIAQCNTLGNEFAASVRDLDPARLEGKRNDIVGLIQANQYVTKHKLVSEPFGFADPLGAMAREQGWKINP